MMCQVHKIKANGTTSELKESHKVDPNRMVDIGSQFSGLVSGVFTKLGYISISDAIEQCEGQGRLRVQIALER